MDPIRFNCRHCKAGLKADSQLAGRYIPCPKCKKNTPVPDSEDELGTYDMSAATAGSKAPKARLRRDAGPSDADWCVPNYETLHPMWREMLENARRHARRRDWRGALTELRSLFQATGGSITPANYLVRKPLAYCLVQWAADDLAAMKGGERLSKPMRQLMRMAADYKKWGGAFSFRECPLCERHDPMRRKSTRVRTAAGPVYLCCAAPTENDLLLVAMAEALRDRLALANALDDRNEVATQGTALFPESLRLLLMENESGWAVQIAGERETGGGFWDEVLGGVIARMPE